VKNHHHHLALLAAQLFTLAAHAHSVDGGSAITTDGLIEHINENALKTIGSSSWPAWQGLRLIDTHTRADNDSESVMTLDDGQRIVGRFESSLRELRWRSHELGSCAVDLERVVWIGPPTIALLAPPTTDRIMLVNGDHIDGFLSALEADRGVAIEIPNPESPSIRTATWVELSKVASIQMVPHQTQTPGWRIWLRDGGVVFVDAWQRLGDQVSLEGTHLPGISSSLSLAWRDIVAVQASNDCIQPLANQACVVTEVSDTPRLAPACALISQGTEPLDLRAIDLHGPGSFTMGVPAGDYNFQATIETPPQLVGKINCLVTILDGEREMFKQHTDSASKPIHIHFHAQGKSLTVILSESQQGAFGAAIRLQDCCFVATHATAPQPISHPSSAEIEPAASRRQGPG